MVNFTIEVRARGTSTLFCMVCLCEYCECSGLEPDVDKRSIVWGLINKLIMDFHEHSVI